MEEDWPLAAVAQELFQLTIDLKAWYFERGGMYLSAAARTAYGNVQEALSFALKNKSDSKVNHSDYDAVRTEWSKLLSELTHDLLSRRGGPEVEL